MTHSASSSSLTTIPTEIISEHEMALIEAAFAAVAALPSTQLHRNSRTIRTITLLSKRGLSAACTTTGSTDIEDSDRVTGSNSPQKNEPLLQQFRKGRAISVTDLTGTEWCEKQMEFSLRLGKPKKTRAMKAGSARHVALEEEVIKRVKVQTESAEDVWALKFMNFIFGANQLLFDGLTRELPLVGFIQGVWMVGIIDEIRMPVSEATRFPILVDTKTRVRATLPGEPQKRNGRLQLMCYKNLWDSLVAERFPSQKFYNFYSLNPNHSLSPEIRENTSKLGFPSENKLIIKYKRPARFPSLQAYSIFDLFTCCLLNNNWTLGDVVRYFETSCSLLPQAHDQLLLRYELQEDQSLLGEEEFSYDSDWVKDQIKSCLDFWMGNREASYPSMEERWKCNFCKFAYVCPARSDLLGSTS